jgi:hypothetical protein
MRSFFKHGMLILNVDPTIKTSELLCTYQKGWYQNNWKNEKITICRKTICRLLQGNHLNTNFVYNQYKINYQV